MNNKPVLLATCNNAGFFLADSWTLEMEATCFSETIVGFQRITRRSVRKIRALLVIFRMKEITSIAEGKHYCIVYKGDKTGIIIIIIIKKYH